MNYQKCDERPYKHDYCHMDDDCHDHEMHSMHEMPHMQHMKEKMGESGYSEMCCDMSQMKCKVEKECVKTYKCYYKLYKVCQYRMYKICPCCGHEFDYHRHRGMCPKCGVNM